MGGPLSRVALLFFNVGEMAIAQRSIFFVSFETRIVKPAGVSNGLRPLKSNARVRGGSQVGYVIYDLLKSNLPKQWGERHHRRMDLRR